MPALRVMIVDDERVSRTTTVQQLVQAGYHAAPAANAYEALERLAEEPWDVVVTDLRMSGMDGLEFLRRLHAAHRDVDAIMMTAFGTVDAAVEAMRLGAAGFLTKPFAFGVLDAHLKKLAEMRAVRAELVRLRSQVGAERSDLGLLGQAPSLREVRERIALFAHHDLPVLITGETGTGKELVARALHDQGARASGPFLALGCGTIPPELAESELFGHEKGAFTGAAARRAGVFERADSGTLLLDDIDDLRGDLQVKLLRVLQDGRFTRVGGTQELETSVRLVATTKVDLEEAVRAQRFRMDLFYRLRALEIHLPPLREREGDVLLLAGHFLARLADREGRPPPRLAEAAAMVLRRSAWPGNVRELRAVIEGAYVLAHGGPIEPPHFPASIGVAEEAPGVFLLRLDGCTHVDFPEQVQRFEHALIDWALRQSGGNQAKAAELLGLPRTTLQSKIAATQDE